MTMTYTETAEQFLQELLEIRAQRAALDKDMMAVQQRLNVCMAQGDLNHLKETGSNTIKFENASFTLNPGRITYDYSNCKDVKEKEAELKELKKTAESLGLVPKKVGTPYWSVRS